MPARLALCETALAITTHLRLVASAGDAWVVKTTLCNRVALYDVAHVPLHQVGCPTCRAVAIRDGYPLLVI